MVAANKPSGYDFDQWATLARQDPQFFETERTRLVESAIRRAPANKQPRLRCLQWKLDQIRKLSATPLAASQRMNQLLWEAFAGRHGLIERLNMLQDKLQAAHSPDQMPPRSAEILPFPD